MAPSRRTAVLERQSREELYADDRVVDQVLLVQPEPLEPHEREAGVVAAVSEHDVNRLYEHLQHPLHVDGLGVRVRQEEAVEEGEVEELEGEEQLAEGVAQREQLQREHRDGGEQRLREHVEDGDEQLHAHHTRQLRADLVERGHLVVVAAAREQARQLQAHRDGEGAHPVGEGEEAGGVEDGVCQREFDASNLLGAGRGGGGMRAEIQGR